MICEIISVGTELLLGDIVNTNAQFLSRQLSSLGLDVYYHSVVGDNMERLVKQINQSGKRADIIITTGGLGPTDDDITKEGLCKALNVELILQENLLKRLEEYFNKFGNKMPEINIRQAYIPQGGKAIINDNGSAPGVIYEDNGKAYILLPGPPNEMIPMFDNIIIPYLREKSDSIIKSKTLKVVGIGESLLQERLQEIIDKQKNPTIALYAKSGEVHIRVTAKSDNIQDADNKIDNVIKSIKELLGDSIFGYDNDTFEQCINTLLQNSQKTIAIAESCTGGLVSSKIIDVPNASKSYLNGIICYSNESKINILGVKEETLNTYGAVSEETAHEMAYNIMKKSGSDIGLSITGVAGPDGGSKEKPVGLCYIGLAFGEEVIINKCIFNGNRNQIRLRATTKALDILRRFLIELEGKR